VISDISFDLPKPTIWQSLSFCLLPAICAAILQLGWWSSSHGLVVAQIPWSIESN
jgi:hypothetical protein